MKKILGIFAFLVVLTILVAPVISLAAEAAPTEATQCTLRHDFSGADWKALGINCPSSGACLFNDPANPLRTCGACCLFDSIYTITNWIFVIVVIIVVIFVLLGAFNIVTAGGSPEKVNTGRSYIIYAIVGAIVAIIAKVIPTIAKNILGM